MKNWLPVILIVFVGCSTDSTDNGPELIESLKDSNPDIRYSAAKSLGELGPAAPGAVYALASALKDPDPAVRIAATYALAKMGPEASSAIPALTRALQDHNREVVLGALYALPAMGSQATSALPTLQNPLRNADDEVRREVARCIMKIKIVVKYQQAHTHRDVNLQAGRP